MGSTTDTFEPVKEEEGYKLVQSSPEVERV